MTAKKVITFAAMVAACAAPPASAFPFPPFQWPWHQAPDCPRSSYSCLHYALPAIYTCRAHHTPPHYVCGCPVPVEFTLYRIDRYPCRATSPELQAAHYLEYREREARAETPQKSGQDMYRENPGNGTGGAGGNR